MGAITDKRVSRRHAILEVMGGQLRIKPIHTNPCFYQSSEKSRLLPLKTNLWHCLNPGDRFSLLVDKYIFRVFSTCSETELECTLRNSQMPSEDNLLNETPKSPAINLSDETTGATQLERSTEITKTQTTNTDSMSFPGECSKQQPNLAQRKRILPAWMLENLSDQDLSISIISGGNVIQGSGKKGLWKDKTSENISQQGRKRSVLSGSSKSTLAKQDTGKKYKNSDQEESIISSKEMPQSLPPNTLSNPEGNTKTKTKRSKISIKKVGEVSEHNNITKGAPDKEEAMSGSQSFSSAQGKSSNDESQGSHPESSSDSSNLETLHAKATDSVPEGPEDNKVKRTSCMYGANCYRKNPVHFQHFSHPGDSDYGGSPVMNQEDTDDRPECPYGASCYRKNPQHKIEFKHSTLPVRDALDEDDDVGQPSEYDLNDSFLDDEEEEYEPTDEDSDWEPGKEEQEKEDVEELLKEAKKFMKRKK